MKSKLLRVLPAVLLLSAFGPHSSARQGGAVAVKAEQNLAIDLSGRVVDVTFNEDVSPIAPWDRFRFDINTVQPLTRDGGAFLGDLTGDGVPDLFLASFDGETLFFPGIAGSPQHFGNGTYLRHTTATASTDPFEFGGALWVTGDVGDLDGDGIKEVAIGQKLYRYVGTPAAPTLDYVYTFAGPIGAWDPAASFGDLNGDGALDVVITYGYSGGSWIYWNASTSGSFSFTGTSLAAPGGPGNRLAMGDLNGDGLLDLAGAVGIYFNTGTAQVPAFNFASPSPWNRSGARLSWTPESDQGTNLYLKDADGDGLLDVYISSLSSTVWQVLFYKNRGTPAAHQLEYMGPVVAASTPLSVVYRGYTTPNFSPHRSYVAAGDVDQNGASDILLSVGTGDFFANPAILWSFPNESGAPLPRRLSYQDLYTYPPMSPHVSYPYGTGVEALFKPPNWFSAWTDMTGDGLRDAVRSELVYVDGVVPTGKLYLRARSGSWPFTLGADSAILTSPSGNQATADGVVLVDVNLDGRLDVVGGAEDGRLLFYRDTAGSGAVTLADPVPLTDSTGTPIDVGNQSWPTAFDLDGDGDADFLVANDTGNIRKIMCVTPGSVQGYAPGALLGTPEQDPVDTTHVVGGGIIAPSLATMDVDGDGLQDVVMGDVDGRVWLLRNIGSSASPSFSLGPLTIPRTAAADMEVIDARTIRLYFALPVTPGQTVLGYHGIATAGSPISGEVVISPDADNAGVLAAAYDSTLKVPVCASVGTGCDSAALLTGKDNMSGGPEPNQPNTLFNSCADGTSGIYPGSESIERVRVTAVDGGLLTPGKQAKIEVTVWANSGSNAADFYYTDNANSPNWIYLTTVYVPWPVGQPFTSGLNVLTTTYTLPSLPIGATLQAVRANFRWGGVKAPCSTGVEDDHDDLAFAVGSERQPPTDVDGDGKSDILWRHNTTGQLFVWMMDGVNISSSQSIGTVSELGWQIQQVGDFNGDDRGDILWRHNTTGQLFMWLMDGFSIIGSQPIGTVSDLGWQIQKVGDFNGDSKADILWRHNTTGQVFVWLMNGVNISSSQSIGWVSDLGWQIQQVGDFNGDRGADILWRHSTTGQLFMWLMDGFSIIGYQPIGTVSDLDWQIQKVGDFNGDGKADILWRHNTTGQLFTWLMDGVNISSSQSIGWVSDLGWQIQQAGDFNGDGKSDILWRHGTTGQLFMWLMDGFSTIGYQPIGTVSDLGWQIQK